MSTFLADADLVEAKFAMYSTDLTQVALNIRHYRITGLTGNVSDTDMAQIMDSNFSPIYGAVIPAAASWYGVQVQIITTLPARLPVVEAGNQITGTFGGDLSPAQVSSLISLRTIITGRAGRGRVYVGFVPTTAIASNTNPTNTYLAALGGVANALMATINVVGALGNCAAVPVLFHRATRTSLDLDSYIIRNRFATQRRRGRFGRINPFPPFA